MEPFVKGTAVGLSRTDWAYLCYAWVAFAVWFETIVDNLPIDSEYRQFVFMVLWAPVTLSIVGASIIAVVYSIRERRELPLLIMMLTLASMAALFLAVDDRGMGSSYVARGWYAAGTALLVLFSLRWYLRKGQDCLG